MVENEEKKPTEEMEDIEVAELANAEIKKRDAEIAKLKKDLAKAKLYSEASDEEEDLLSVDEYRTKIADNSNLQYDVIDNTVKLCEAYKAQGNPEPYNEVFRLGEQSEEVYTFLKDCVDACEGDKSQFIAIYQSMLAPDDPKIAAAYRKRNLNN